MKGKSRLDQKCGWSSYSRRLPFPLPLAVAHRPDWAGEGVVSSLVSALINNKFLYGFMKIGARKVWILEGRKASEGERGKGRRLGSR